MKKGLRITSRAWRQIERASAWWREHRDKAPDAFDIDFDAALDYIRENSSAGVPVRARRIGVRSLWLERIGYFVYYRVLSEDLVEIIGIWHAARGARPRV